MRALSLTLAVVLMTVCCAGCRSLEADFTVLSNKNVNFPGLQAARMGEHKEVEGKDVTHYFLFIPISSYANLERAVDNALKEGNGDVMVDAKIYSYSWTILLFGQVGWSVEGKVLNSYSKPGGAPAPTPAKTP